MPFGGGAIQPNCMLVCSGTLLPHSLVLVFYYRPQHACTPVKPFWTQGTVSVSNLFLVCHSSKPLPTTIFSPGTGDFAVLVGPNIIGVFMGSDNDTCIDIMYCSSPLYIADRVDQVYQTPCEYLNECSQRQQDAFLSNTNIILTSIAVLCIICTGDSCMGNDQIRDTDIAAGNVSCFAQTKLHASNITFVMRLEVTLDCGKKFTVVLQTCRLVRAFYHKWPTTQDRAAVKRLDPFTHIHRDISAGKVVFPKHRARLRQGVAHVLAFINTASEINTLGPRHHEVGAMDLSTTWHILIMKWI